MQSLHKQTSEDTKRRTMMMCIVLGKNYEHLFIMEDPKVRNVPKIILLKETD